MGEPPNVKTMRLRYAGSCSACGCHMDKGETAHYLPPTKTVRCLACGTAVDRVAPVMAAEQWEAEAEVAQPATVIELVQGPTARTGNCGDCGRRIARGAEALSDIGGPVLCLECVALDTLHVVGLAGGGARREHAKRSNATGRGSAPSILASAASSWP